MAKHPTCLIIGSLDDQERLNILANKIIAPIVRNMGYQIEIPSQDDLKSKFNEIILKIELSKLIIVDLTDYSLNSIYLLAISQSFGHHCLVVRDKSKEKEKIFDTDIFQIHDIDFKNVKTSTELLFPFIKYANDKINRKLIDENIITKNFNGPLTGISPVNGLAYGYFNNFLLKILPFLIEKKLKLIIVIPKTLELSNSNYINEELIKRGILRIITFKSKIITRPITVYQLTSKRSYILDIPTAINAISPYIQKKLSRKKHLFDLDQREYFELESIQNFKFALDKFIREKEEISKKSYRNWIEIRDWDEIF